MGGQSADLPSENGPARAFVAHVPRMRERRNGASVDRPPRVGEQLCGGTPRHEHMRSEALVEGTDEQRQALGGAACLRPMVDVEDRSGHHTSVAPPPGNTPAVVPG